MVVITDEFLTSLDVPAYAWVSETINGKHYRSLHNEKYAQVFWTHFWLHVMAEKLSKQKMIRQVVGFNPTGTVYIETKTGRLSMCQKQIKEIDYYSRFSDEKKIREAAKGLPFRMLSNFSTNAIFITYLIVMFVIFFVTNIFFRNKTNINVI